jgi:hypothetical protein
MKRSLSFLFACMGWFAVITQFVLMIEQKTASTLETLIRFFSFFTILTNIIVAIYFSLILFYKNENLRSITRPGILTAMTIYIFMVGSVYQVALRHVWNPEGIQLIVDELLHSIIPALVIIFWTLYENKQAVKYSQIPKWAIYPISYLLYILIRGSFSNFYPYPFVNVNEIGLTKALINSAILLLIFLFFATMFVFIGRFFSKKRKIAAISSS